MITEATATKIIFISAGSLTLGLTEANMVYLILGVVGLVFSLANYHYDFEHGDVEEFILSELLRYMLFGFLTLPAVYIVLENYVGNEVLRIIIGSLVSYFSVKILETIFKRALIFIMEWKK
ncbi:MAG: hypothetical protein PHX65_07180 [Sulfurimonas sp.]|nr:hypothetical protein [Sulfurimonas sp.]